MQRLTARFLLFFALVGTLVPLASAATPAPLHACCIRKAHHCHDSEPSDSTKLAIRATSCCNHDCCRALTTPQWAHPQPLVTAFSAHYVDANVAESYRPAPSAEVAASQSTRAPPAC